MLRTPPRQRRRGAAMVEAAIVLPITLVLILGLIIGAVGIFRYQEVAFLAREGARYAAVHGQTYGKEMNHPAPTADEIFENAILSRTITLDRSLMSYDVSWDASNDPYTIVGDYERPRANTVTVTVSYQWFPELFFVGPITLSSTSTMTMSY